MNLVVVARSAGSAISTFDYFGAVGACLDLVGGGVEIRAFVRGVSLDFFDGRIGELSVSAQSAAMILRKTAIFAALRRGRTLCVRVSRAAPRELAEVSGRAWDCNRNPLPGSVARAARASRVRPEVEAVASRRARVPGDRFATALAWND